MFGIHRAIIPEDGKLYAPVVGVIAAFFPTGHAVDIQTAEGIEILIHIGMDTVSLKGKGRLPAMGKNSK